MSSVPLALVYLSEFQCVTIFLIAIKQSAEGKAVFKHVGYLVDAEEVKEYWQ